MGLLDGVFMFGTRTATVYPRDWSAVDRLHNSVEAYLTPVDTPVTVSVGSTTALDNTRPEGVRVALTLHFLKSWDTSINLRGAKVTLEDEYAGTYRVIGNPHPHQVEDSPTPYLMGVEVEQVG